MSNMPQLDPMDPTNFDLDAFLKMLDSGPDDFIRQAEETKVPGLANRIREMYEEGGGGIENVGAPFWIRATTEIANAKNNPAEYASTRLNQLAREYTLGTAQGYDPQFAKIYGADAPNKLNEIKALQGYLTSNNYATNEQIGAALSAGEQAATSQLITDKRAGQSGSFKEAVGFLAPIVLGAVVPGLGSSIGASLGLSGTAATVVGQSIVNTVLNGGDLKSGIVAAAIPVVGKEVAGTVAKTFIESGMDKAVANTVGNVVSNTGIALMQGKDPVQALLAGGVSAGVSAGTGQIPGMSDLPDFLKNTINAGVTAELLNGNGIQAATNSLLNYKIPLKNTSTGSPTEAPLDEEEQAQLIENRLNKAIGQSQISPEEEDANTRSAIEELERLYGPSATTTPEDTVRSLENAGLTQKADDDVLITGKSDKTLALPEHDYNPIDDYFKPTKGIEELLVTGKSEKETPAETPTYSPIDDYFKPTKGVEELLVTGKSEKPSTEPSYLPTDDDFPRTPIRDEGEMVVVGKRPDERPPLSLDVDPITMDPVPVELPKLPTTTTTPKTTKPKTPTAPAPAPASTTAAKQSTAQSVVPALLGMPQLGNMFYYGKDFSSQKQELDPSGKLVQQEYDPLSVTQAGPELQLDKIAGTNENDVQALIEQIMASNGGDISPEELAQILGQQGASYG